MTEYEFIDYRNLINVNNYKIKEFNNSQVKYKAYVDELFSLYEFNIILYDEVENFKDYNSPLFNYPYE